MKILDLGTHFEKRTYEYGDIIYDLGKRAEHIYFIEEG